MIFIMLYYTPWCKEYLWCGIYLLLVGLYFVGHHLTVSKELVLPSDYQYSLFGEAFYILRMIFPFVILYITKKLNVTYEKFIVCIQIISTIIGVVIIVGNLLHISLTSYYTPEMYTQLNFIEWFFEDVNQYSFEALTSKGWFFMANQISGLMMLLLPFNLYDFLKNRTKLSVVSVFSLSISMLLLGTRVATYGSIAMILLYLFLFVFFKLIKKESLEWRRIRGLIVLIILMVGLFVNSPIQNRIYSYGNVEIEEEPGIETDEKDHSDTVNEKYILAHYKDYKISEKYLFSIYPYYEDSEFWIKFMEEHQGEVQNNRQMQKALVHRIDELNGNIKEKLFGYSFTRFTSGGLYLEQDIAVHYYTVGIIGIIILLGPWFVSLILLGVKILQRIPSRFNFLNCTFLGAIATCIGCSWFSGHVLDELIVTLILGFVVGVSINIVGDNYEEN